MISIKKSPNADSRTMDDGAGKEELRQSTISHIHDVDLCMNMIADMIISRAKDHDHTKMEMMDEFYHALKTGNIKDTQWYNHHVTAERHHVKTYVHQDINLIDIIEAVCDCCMAGLARSGEIYDTDIDPAVLQLAVQNTVKLIKKNTRVCDQNDPQLNKQD